MTPNKFVELEDCIEMTCHDRNGCPKPEKVYFDKEDLDLVRQYQWHTYKDAHAKTFYCLTNIWAGDKRTTRSLHQLILPTQKPLSVDHRDLNGCNNRRSNLRQATAHQQGTNTSMHRRNKSGVKGVHYNTKDRRWKAHMVVNRVYLYLGYFLTIEEATHARKQAEVKYGFGS